MRLDECVICLEDFLIFPRSCCSAYVCDGCMNSHVTVQVTSGVWKVVCPGQACGARLPEDELLTWLKDTNTRELYQRLKVDSYAVPYTKTCPHCKLITTVKPRSTETARYDTHGLEIMCEKCAFQWCFRCHGPAHPEMTCVARPDDLFIAWAGDHLYGEFPNAVPCPQCKTYVQHYGGCNNMTCSVCGKDFCYLCGNQTCHHNVYVQPAVDHINPMERPNLGRVNRIDLEEELPQMREPSACWMWQETVCGWRAAAFLWADARSTAVGRFCSAFWLTLAVCLLLLLFPISAPVCIVIYLAVPRFRHRDNPLEILDREAAWWREELGRHPLEAGHRHDGNLDDGNFEFPGASRL